MPDPQDDFFNEIDAVCRKYGVSISHEDGQGGFIIEPYSDFNIDWLKAAEIRTAFDVTRWEPYGAPRSPVPPDWDCQECGRHNMGGRFFCVNCGTRKEMPTDAP